MTTTREIITEDQAKRLSEYLVGLPVPFTVTWKEGRVRSLNQNALLHKWFREVAQHKGDVTPDEVKGQCHRKYGLAIKLEDPQFAWVWDQTGAKMPYEKQCALLASGILTVSSTMTTAELTTYMDAMQRDYMQEGVRLTIPEERE